jgi:hypothetical protein
MLAQEVEVAALVGLQDLVAVEAGVAAFGIGGGVVGRRARKLLRALPISPDLGCAATNPSNMSRAATRLFRTLL